MVRPALALLVMSLAAGCDAVAGLDEFRPAEAGGAASGGGGSGGAPPEAGADPGGAPPLGGGGSAPDNCADDLLISELRTYGVGQGDDDFVEIYNPTNGPLSLESVSLWAYKPPSGTAMERWHGEATDEIPPGGRFVLGGLGFDPELSDATLGVGASIGDSQIVLLRRGPSASPSTIDHMCVCTNDCGQNIWGGCPGVLPNPAYILGKIEPVPDSLSRVPDCEDTDDESDFTPGAPTPGQPNDP